MSEKLLRQVVRTQLKNKRMINEEIPILGKLFDWLGGMLDDLVDAGIDMAKEWQQEVSSELSSAISSATDSAASDMGWDDAPDYDKLDVKGGGKDRILWAITQVESLPDSLEKAAGQLGEGDGITKIAPDGDDDKAIKEFEPDKEKLMAIAGGCGAVAAVCSHLGKHLPSFEAFAGEIEDGLKDPSMIPALKAAGKAANSIASDVSGLIDEAESSDEFEEFEDSIDLDASDIESAAKDIVKVASKLIPTLEKLKGEMEKKAEEKKKEGGGGGSANEALIRRYVSGLLKERYRRRI